jgi:hypothetical protein
MIVSRPATGRYSHAPDQNRKSQFASDKHKLCANAKTGKVIEENARIEKRIRKLGIGKKPTLPFDASQIQQYGNDLINDLLPRVIEKEIRLNKYLQGLAK